MLNSFFILFDLDVSKYGDNSCLNPAHDLQRMALPKDINIIRETMQPNR